MHKYAGNMQRYAKNMQVYAKKNARNMQICRLYQSKCKKYAVKICRNMPFYMQNMPKSIYSIFCIIFTPHFADGSEALKELN